MRIKASQKQLEHLVSGERIPLETIVCVFHEHCGFLEEEVEYANSLLPEAGTYLDTWNLRKFVRAEIADEFVHKQIKQIRMLLSRIRSLFPEIVAQLRITNPNRARTAFSIIYDECSDYPTTLASGRREANRRKLIQRIKKLRQTATEFSQALEKETIHESEFLNAQRLYLKRVHGVDNETQPFWKLKRDIQILSWFLELEAHRIDADPDRVRVKHDQAKTSIVDTVYRLVLSDGYPPFVTTPGSDFSHLCSLVFEIATGQRDESFAGAINRFARCTERAEIDQYHLDYSDERDRMRDADNFYDIKNSEIGMREKAAVLLKEVRNPSLSPEARMLVMCEIEELIESLDNLDKIHGPSIMWASQIRRDWEGELQAMEARDVQKLHHDIELGNSRRSKHKLT